MENSSMRRLWSVAEISCQCNVSKYFLRKQINEGNLPYYKIGNCFMLFLDDVEALINSLKHQNEKSASSTEN